MTRTTRQLGVAGAALIIVSIAAASSKTTQDILGPGAPIARVAVAIMLGSAFGWWVAASGGAIEQGLWLLFPSTALAALPMALWTSSRNPALLALAAISWFVSGYLFAVAIWL